jgi:hypothetical protein
MRIRHFPEKQISPVTLATDTERVTKRQVRAYVPPRTCRARTMRRQCDFHGWNPVWVVAGLP